MSSCVGRSCAGNDGDDDSVPVAVAVGIVAERAGGAVVEDVVVAVLGLLAGPEHARIERPAGKGREDIAIELDPVPAGPEVLDQVGVAAIGRVGEAEDIAALAAR